MPAVPAAVASDRVLVVVGLDGTDPARLASGLGVSVYEAQQGARRGGYHLHRATARGEAALERQRLESAGIPVFTFEEADVRAAAEPEPALAGRFEGGVLKLRTPGGSAETAGSDILIVVKGPITRELPPMESRKWARTATLEPGFRFHIHRHAAPRPIEIDPAAFDFGAHRAAESSLLEIAGWMAALAADVAVDDGFRRISPALSPAAPPSGPGARLEDALRTAPRVNAILDNVAQFRFYSAWRGAVERKVRLR